MAVREHLSEKYRKRIDEFLTDQSDLKLSEPLSQIERDEIWEDISDEMDIGETWDRISSDLGQVMPSNLDFSIIFKFIAALLIMFVALIPVKKEIQIAGTGQKEFLIPQEQIENTKETITENIHKGPDTEERLNGEPPSPSGYISDSGKDVQDPIRTEYNGTGLINQTPYIVADGLTAGIADTSELDEANIHSPFPDNQFEKSRISPDLLINRQEIADIPAEINYFDAGIKSNRSGTGPAIPYNTKGRISVGLVTIVRNTWLLNHETFNGLKMESLNTTLIVFSPDVGLSFNYSLNNNWKLQADGFIYSNTGQEYLQYINGHYIKKHITLSYSKIALSVKYKLTGKEDVRGRASINLVAGSYLSVLQNARQKINNDLEDIESQYGKFDYGLRIGSELDLRLFEHFSLVPGLFLSIGLPNIYQGDGYIPGYFRRTHNACAGFQLVFYYSH